MSNEELKIIYLEWIKDYCQNDFKDKEGNIVIPPMVELVIDEMIEYKESGIYNKKSESLGDYSVTFNHSESISSRNEPFPSWIMAKLKPYCNRGKVRFY